MGFAAEPGRRRGRGKSGKHEAIYGCFGGSTSEEDESASRYRRSRAKKRRRGSSSESSDGGGDGTIQFVKGGLLQPGEDPAEENPAQKPRGEEKKSRSSQKHRLRDPLASSDSQVKLRVVKPRERQSAKDELVLKGLSLGYSDSEEEKEKSAEEYAAPSRALSPKSGESEARLDSSSDEDEDASSSPRNRRRSSSSSDDEEEEEAPAREGSSSRSRSASPKRRVFAFKEEVAKTQSAAKTAGAQNHTWGYARMQKAYGKGFELLKKMGFKGGALGKDGEGLVNPIEVKIRKKNKALQDEGERLQPGEKGAAPPAVVPLPALDAASPSAVFSWKRPVDALPREDGGVARLEGHSDAWRRSSTRDKSKRLLKTPSQIAAEKRLAPLAQQKASSQQLRVLDMTGPQVRVLESSEEIKEALLLQTEERRQREEKLLLGEGGAAEDGDAREEQVPLSNLQNALRRQVRVVERQLQNAVSEKQMQEQLLLSAAEDDREMLEKAAYQKQTTQAAERLMESVLETYKLIKNRTSSKLRNEKQTEAQVGNSRAKRRVASSARPQEEASSADTESSEEEEPAYRHLTGGLSVEELLSRVKLWKRDSPEPFRCLQGAAVGAALLRLLLKRVLSSAWNPLEKPAPRLAASLCEWLEVYASLQVSAEDSRSTQTPPPCSDWERSVFEIAERKAAASTASTLRREGFARAFDFLKENLEASVGVSLRRVLLNDWKPQMETPAALSLTATWSRVLGVTAVSTFLHVPLLQRLRSEVEDWLPTEAETPLHLWLLPWLQVLPSTAAEEQLLEPLQEKLGHALQSGWTAQDSSAKALLLPWKSVFPDRLWRQVLQRGVLPQLYERLLQMRLNTEPLERLSEAQKQPLKDVLAWEGVVPADLFGRLFCEAFFPRWLQLLRAWIASPHADAASICQWYGQWRHALPASLVSDAGVAALLTEALRVVAGGNPLPAEVLQPQVFGAESAAVPSEPPPPSPDEAAPAGGETRDALRHRPSLREALESLAATHGISFKAKEGRIEKGHQVYVFGRFSVFFRDGVIYHRARNAEEWKPTDPESILAKCIKAK